MAGVVNPELELVSAFSAIVQSEFQPDMNKVASGKGVDIEVIGKLREMPRAATMPTWKAYCGIEKLAAAPSGGRWVLEMQEP